MRTTQPLAVALVLFLAACGGDSGSSDEPTTTDEVDSSASTSVTETTEESMTTTTVATETDETTEEAAADEDTAVVGAGTATLQIGDMVLEFTDLACYYDNEAVEMAADDDATFVAASIDGDEGIYVVLEEGGVTTFRVFYAPGDGTQWTATMVQEGRLQNVAYYIVEGDRVTAEGDFELVVDSESVETQMGSLNANCS